MPDNNKAISTASSTVPIKPPSPKPPSPKPSSTKPSSHQPSPPKPAPAKPSPFQALVGTRYQLIKPLDKHAARKLAGRRTFLAKDLKTKRPVAIKLMLFGPDFTWQDFKLFEREAQTLEAIDHPAIPKYIDFFEVETPLVKGFALVQAYVKAKSLQDWILSGRRFSEQDLIRIAHAILNIFQYLHEQKPAIIHRDIKPSNILLAEDTLNKSSLNENTSQATTELTSSKEQDPFKIVLIDFGAVQTIPQDGTMTVVGTYGYMAPEQFGSRARPASDLYSLGATLIYLATGEHPANLMEDGLQIQFQSTLSEPFTQWLKQLTDINLSKRTSSAAIALKQLANPQSLGALQPTNQQPKALSLSERRSKAEHRTYEGLHLYYTTHTDTPKKVARELELDCAQRRIVIRELPTGPHLIDLAIALSSGLKKGKFKENLKLWWANTKQRTDVTSGYQPLTPEQKKRLIIAGFALIPMISIILFSPLPSLTTFVGVPCLAVIALATPLRFLGEARTTRASLRLFHNPDDTVEVSLLAPLPRLHTANVNNEKNRQDRSSATLDSIHIEKSRLEKVTIWKTVPLAMHQVRLTIAASKYHGRREIMVLCSPKELRWLHSRLAQWRNLTIHPATFKDYLR